MSNILFFDLLIEDIIRLHYYDGSSLTETLTTGCHNGYFFIQSLTRNFLLQLFLYVKRTIGYAASPRTNEQMQSILFHGKLLF
jgi:hypothetical protein